MTIKEAQELIEAWNEKHAVHNSELTSIALLTEKVGELARAVAHRQSEPPHHTKVCDEKPLSIEIAEIFWELLAFADQTGIDLTEALICALEKKNGY